MSEKGSDNWCVETACMSVEDLVVVVSAYASVTLFNRLKSALPPAAHPASTVEAAIIAASGTMNLNQERSNCMGVLSVTTIRAFLDQ